MMIYCDDLSDKFAESFLFFICYESMKAQKTASNPTLRIVTEKVCMKYRPTQPLKLEGDSPPT